MEKERSYGLLRNLKTSSFQPNFLKKKRLKPFVSHNYHPSSDGNFFSVIKQNIVCSVV